VPKTGGNRRNLRSVARVRPSAGLQFRRAITNLGWCCRRVLYRRKLAGAWVDTRDGRLAWQCPERLVWFGFTVAWTCPTEV